MLDPARRMRGAGGVRVGRAAQQLGFSFDTLPCRKRSALPGACAGAGGVRVGRAAQQLGFSFDTLPCRKRSTLPVACAGAGGVRVERAAQQLGYLFDTLPCRKRSALPGACAGAGGVRVGRAAQQLRDVPAAPGRGAAGDRADRAVYGRRRGGHARARAAAARRAAARRRSLHGALHRAGGARPRGSRCGPQRFRSCACQRPGLLRSPALTLRPAQAWRATGSRQARCAGRSRCSRRRPWRTPAPASAPRSRPTSRPRARPWAPWRCCRCARARARGLRTRTARRPSSKDGNCWRSGAPAWQCSTLGSYFMCVHPCPLHYARTSRILNAGAPFPRRGLLRRAPAGRGNRRARLRGARARHLADYGHAGGPLRTPWPFTGNHGKEFLLRILRSRTEEAPLNSVWLPRRAQPALVLC